MIVSSLLPAFTTPAAAVADEVCEDVVLLGLAGSGQRGQGLGIPMRALRSGFERRLDRLADGLTYRTHEVDYTAESTDSLLHGGAEGRARFFRSIVEGKQNLLAELRRRARACPAQHYALAGYSQGAMAVQAALRETTSAERVSAVGLIASGDRVPSWPAVEIGTSRTGTGARPALLGGSAWAPPSWFFPRVYSLCNANDIVCDHVRWQTSAILPQDAIAIHTSSYDGSAGSLGWSMAEKVAGVAVPAEPAQHVRGEPGEPFAVQLHARSFTSVAPRWRTDRKGQWPSGVTMSADGVVRGTTGRTSRRLSASVRGRTHGVWVPVEVVLDVRPSTDPCRPVVEPAEHVVVGFAGKVRDSYVHDPGDLEPRGLVPEGTRVTGYYTFPRNMPESGGSYFLSGDVPYFTLDIGPYRFCTSRSGLAGGIDLEDDIGELDRYTVSVVDPEKGIGDLRWSLEDPRGEALSSSLLQDEAPNLADWAVNNLRLDMTAEGQGTFGTFVNITVDSATTVR